jgi:hypothetical protein
MKFIPKSVTRNLGMKVLTLKKNSPHIFFVAGIVGTVGSTVLACRATLKLEEHVDEIRHDIEQVKSMGQAAKDNGGEYAEKEYYRDLGYVFGKGTLKLGKLYGPSIVLGAASIGALTGSHVQLTRRNSALTATLAVVSQAYENYRLRIQEELGEERERDIYRNAQEVEVIGEKGKTEKAKISSSNAWSPYAKLFDQTNPNWFKDPEANRVFLQLQQNYFNDKLVSRGHVFLNEVYDQLGFDHTKAGAVVGWLYNGDHDNHIDFGIFKEENSLFINGHERSIWLDFNVDGEIYDRI